MTTVWLIMCGVFPTSAASYSVITDFDKKQVMAFLDAGNGASADSMECLSDIQGASPLCKMYSQIESAETEINLHQEIHLHQIDLHQEEAVQLLRESILRLLHALKANRPPEETWVSVVDKVEQGMDSLMVLDWSNGRDGLMLIKQGLATILEVRAGLKVMNSEIAAETLASVKQGLGMLEQNDATEQIGRSIASMVSLHLHPKSEGTKHGSFESVLGLLYPGLMGNALEESNKLVGEVAVHADWQRFLE